MVYNYDMEKEWSVCAVFSVQSSPHCVYVCVCVAYPVRQVMKDQDVLPYNAPASISEKRRALVLLQAVLLQAVLLSLPGH